MLVTRICVRTQNLQTHPTEKLERRYLDPGTGMGNTITNVVLGQVTTIKTTAARTTASKALAVAATRVGPEHGCIKPFTPALTHHSSELEIAVRSTMIN